MNIEEKSLALWAADASATLLVPTHRFKPPGNWQKLDVPYIVQYPISEEVIQLHGSVAALRIWDFYQFSVFARTYSEARMIAEKLRSVFNGSKGQAHYLYRGQRWITQDQDLGQGMMAVSFRIAETLQ